MLWLIQTPNCASPLPVYIPFLVRIFACIIVICLWLVVYSTYNTIFMCVNSHILFTCVPHILLNHKITLILLINQAISFDLRIGRSSGSKNDIFLVLYIHYSEVVDLSMFLHSLHMC